MNYYNEHDPKAAAWLRELIKAGEIPAGKVDERSIVDVNPYELTQYTQHHFFAGIGGWSYALRLAGWPEDKHVVTGSCPCQPFSAAGKGLGEKDERHLWPVFRDIIAFLSPSNVFGEQVASAAGRLWLARVRADLENMGYAVGAADLCAAGVGSPNIRQRLYWMAHADENRRSTRGGNKRRTQSSRSTHRHDAERCSSDDSRGLEYTESDGRQQRRTEPVGRGAASGCSTGGLADAIGERGSSGATRSTDASHAGQPSEARRERERERPPVWLGHANNSGSQGRNKHEHGIDERTFRAASLGHWSEYAVVECTDGKARRFEPGSFPLAHGIPGRVGLLRGYGNAIVPEIAAEFIRAGVEAAGVSATSPEVSTR